MTAAVYKAIAAVQGELAKTGIGKDSENTFDRYKFRGIDAVYNALAPLLAKHGLCVLPRIIERDCQERVSRKGEPMFYITVTGEFDFVSAEDGSKHTVRTYGEAMDRSDKATNKAMSAAYKYAAFMAFAIPTEGDNDADASTPDAGVREVGQGQSQGGAVSPDQQSRRSPPLKGPIKTRSELRNACGIFTRDLHGCADEDMLAVVLRDNKALIEQVQDEHEFYWNGDGADFLGLKGEIEAAKARIAMENMA